VLTVMSCAAAGLHHAHEAVGPDGKPLGLVHRDVSPANILVGYNGIVKVTDFASRSDAAHRRDAFGHAQGKVAYMSPEQSPGARSIAGATCSRLHRVLRVATARRLFKNENDFLTMSAIVQSEIPQPSLHRPDLPRASRR